MNTLPQIIKNYLKNCQEQKRLDAKTIKAYQIDLTQFFSKQITFMTSQLQKSKDT